jgi:DNA invertase Pin-like site-specific DNA recombinase
MKKLLIAVCFMLGFAGIASAQQVKKKIEPTAAKIEKAKPAAAAATTATPKKADGTPDKRFKANKEKKTPEGKLKKDGTPDMRYSENKKKKG